MNCPNDGTELKMGDRQGVEIDYCPECRGVWLDRGELDKIIERSDRDDDDDDRQRYQQQQAPPPPPPQHYGHQPAPGYYYKKKKSWLHEIFD